MTRLEKLMMRVEMIDRVSGPANKVAASLDNITRRAEMGFTSIAKGGVGIMATGYALNRLTRDAREMTRAIGEVKSLDVADDVLAGLERRALSFSMAYGESATEFVRSSYDIQSAIAGLVGNELATFTEASNLLAKATKSDAGTITNYMGTMYGIFKNSADLMGKATWVEELTGQTASAVQMFKTTGSEMAAAFGRIGASAESHGIKVGEQMAILGTLQATMSGSEAGTRYQAFLGGVGKAQDALGLKFEDAHGRMLPMTDILELLRERFGAIDTVAKSDMLQKAFGSKEAVAVVKLLMNDTDGLAESIDRLNNVTGMDSARVMANAMVDPLDRLNHASIALRISFGKFLLNSLNPFYDRVAEGMSTLTRWTQMFPHLTGLVAKITLGVFAFTAALSALLIIKGLYILTALAVTTAWTAMIFVMKPIAWLLKLQNMAWLAGRTALLLKLTALGAYRVALLAIRGAMLIGTASIWLFNAAMLANPITWIVVAVMALVGGLVMLYQHWDSVTASLGRVREMIEDNPIMHFLLAPLLAVIDAVKMLLSGLAKLPEFFKWLGGINPFALLGKGVDWLIDKLNRIPGVKIKTDSAPNMPAMQLDHMINDQREREHSNTPVLAARHVPPGGLMEQINNNNRSNTTHIDKIEVNTSQQVNGYRLADELQMAAG